MSLPIIDVGPFFSQERDTGLCDKVVQEIRDACQTVGSFAVVGHPIPSNLVDALLAASREFFTIAPPEEKMKIRLDFESYRGYQPLGANYTKGVSDIQEAIDEYRELQPGEVNENIFAENDKLRLFAYGRNKWPTIPANYQQLAEDFIGRALQLCSVLMEAMALSLNLPAKHFTPYMDRSYWAFRANYYPQMKEKALGVGEHTDYGFLAVIADDGPQNCLEVQLQDGSWVPVTRPPGSLVCIFGNMMSRATGKKCRATPHRVMASTEGDRVSIPLFFEPNFDAHITHLSDTEDDEVHGVYLMRKIHANFVPAASIQGAAYRSFL